MFYNIVKHEVSYAKKQNSCITAVKNLLMLAVLIYKAQFAFMAAIPARPDDSKTVFSQITQKTQIPYKKS